MNDLMFLQITKWCCFSLYLSYSTLELFAIYMICWVSTTSNLYIICGCLRFRNVLCFWFLCICFLLCYYVFIKLKKNVRKRQVDFFVSDSNSERNRRKCTKNIQAWGALGFMRYYVLLHSSSSFPLLKVRGKFVFMYITAIVKETIEKDWVITESSHYFGSW